MKTTIGWMLGIVLTSMVSAGPSNAATLREKIDRSFPMRAGGSFELANVNGAVTVATWNRPEIRVQAEKVVRGVDDRKARRALAQIRVEFDHKPGLLKIATRSGRSEGDVWNVIFGNGGHGSVTYTITTPSNVKVNVETTNGAINVTGVKAPVDAESTNGAIRVKEVSGNVIAETTNGSIEVDVDQLASAGAITCETTNGGITVRLPETFAGAIDADTTNGSIKTDFQVAPGKISRTTLRGTVGRGASRVNLETTNGGIKILMAGR